MKATLVILGATFIVFGSLYYIGQKKVEKIVQDVVYIGVTYEDQTNIFDATVTDKERDYFVVTDKNETYYVTISGEDEGITHKEELVEEGSTLDDVKKETIKRSNEPKKTSDTYFVPFFLPY